MNRSGSARNLFAALVIAVVCAFSGACNSPLFRPMPQVVDLAAVADEVALYRADVEDLASLYPPETQAKLLDLVAEMRAVEDALRAGDAMAASSVAALALEAADQFLAATDPENGARIYVLLAKVALRHLRLGQPADVVPPDEVPVEQARASDIAVE